MRKQSIAPKALGTWPKLLTLSKIPRCYSAYEHSALYASSPHQFTVASSPVLQSPSIGLPVDIAIETILSVIFICVGLVIGAEELKPISWKVWAGKAERESGGGGPFQGLEDRFGFVDIRVRVPCDQWASIALGLSLCREYNLWANAF